MEKSRRELIDQLNQISYGIDLFRQKKMTAREFWRYYPEKLEHKIEICNKCIKRLKERNDKILKQLRYEFTEN
jgi:hypothetical protein